MCAKTRKYLHIQSLLICGEISPVLAISGDRGRNRGVFATDGF